ncbi:MAG: hypothetical protein KGY99_08780 [Phycisphaerae bacterium]|nr:hypothetical protein [Phycisphaerae bacterium]
MKRRVLLLVGTFGALLAALLAYQVVVRYDIVRPDETPGLRDGPQHAAPAGADDVGQLEPRHGEGLDITLGQDEPVGRRFQCDRYEKDGKYGYDLGNPKLTFFFADGQVATIRADRGYGRFAGSIMEVDFQELRLSQNVVLTLDRGKSPLQAPLDQRPADRVVMRMDSVLFDRHLLRIETNSRVELHAAEGDVYGRGMEATWTENPRQLKLLRIVEGERIVLHDVPEGMDMFALPGAEATSSDSRTPEAADEPDAPDPPRAARTAPAEPPATRPEQGDAPDNVYRIELFDAVRVMSADGRMDGADSLAVRVEWDRSMLGEDEAPSDAPREAQPPADATRPATRPATRKQNAVIRWKGNLVIRPVGWTPSPSSDRYTAAARGAPLRLTDGQTRATCQSFAYWQDAAPDGTGRRQRGQLTGTADEPATLRLDDGSRVECAVMRYDRLAARAELQGAGRMTRRGAALFDGEGAEADGEDKPQQIAWRDSGMLVLADRSEADGGTGLERVERALFRGEVRLRQGEGDEAEFVHCDELRLRRAPPPHRRHRQAEAIGNVHVRAMGLDAHARRGLLTAEPKDEPSGESGLEVTRIEMHGDVRSRTIETDEPVTATGDRVVADVRQRNAVLYGDKAPTGWAELRQGASRLRGEQLRFYLVADPRGDGNEVEVRSKGPGALDFVTRRGFGGQDLSEPRAIRVTWAKSMNYQGPRDVAEFVGDVTLDSGPDHVTAEAMRVRFRRTEDDKTEAPAPSREEDADALPVALSMEDFSSKRIRMIRAQGADPKDRNVLWVRREVDDDGKLLRRVQLRSTDFHYDVDLARAIITSWGKAIVEDYRAPKPADTTDEDGEALGGMRLQRPSQSVLEWQPAERTPGEPVAGPACYMELLQKQRQATVQGDVTVRHRSGRKMVRRAALPDGRWETLPPGQAFDLRCGRAVVWFAEPDDDDDAADGGDGLQIGPLKRFSATRRVNMRYAPWQVLGERVWYDRSRDIVTAQGFRPGQPPADAQIIYEDPETGRSQTWSNPKLTLFPGKQQVLSEDASATGGR